MKKSFKISFNPPKSVINPLKSEKILQNPLKFEQFHKILKI